MLLSTSIGYMCEQLGMKPAIDMYAEVGYDALDMSMFNMATVEKGLEEYYKDIREYSNARGLVFNQAHAPFPSSMNNAEETEKRFDDIVTAMKYASILGVKNIVVHPCQHLAYAKEGVPEKLFEINMEFYTRLIPYCEEYGIRVALENMWQGIGPHKISHSTCSKPEEFIRYMDTLNNDCFTACLDIGHTILCCEDPADFIRALGKKRLGALHVHDVDGIEDLHTLPYLGIANWDKIAKALAEIDYCGDFTYEANGVYKTKPVELFKAYQTLAVQTGRLIMGKIQSYK